MGKKHAPAIVTDEHNAMTLGEREAAMVESIKRLAGGRPEHMMHLADCIRLVGESDTSTVDPDHRPLVP